MGVKERKLRQKRFLRQEIMDAASELFVKEGYENVSMRRIAERIEYSPTTIYLHFRDKADLLEQVCNETFSRLNQILTGILSQPGEPVSRLRRGLMAYVQFGLENPQQYRAVFMMPLPEEIHRAKHANPESLGLKAFDFLRRSVADCIAAGKMRAKDPELICQTLWSAAHGVTSLLITHGAFPWANKPQLVETVIDSAIAGVSLKAL